MFFYKMPHLQTPTVHVHSADSARGFPAEMAEFFRQGDGEAGGE